VLAVVTVVLALPPASAALRHNSGGWERIGLSAGGAMFTPPVSPVDPNLMLRWRCPEE